MGDVVPAEVLAGLHRGELILTGKERAARAVRLAWNRQQAASGKTSWEPANVLSWRSWTHLLWRKLLLDGRVDALLLSQFQEERVWGRVLTADTLSRSIQTPTSLAATAAKTWRQLCAYEGTRRLQKAIPQLKGDFLQFARWTQAFEKTCATGSLLSEAFLETELQVHLASRDLNEWTQGILLLGFDQLSPAQMSLIRHCRSLDLAMELIPTPQRGEGTLVPAGDEHEELRGCASWIRDQLRGCPGIRVAVIVNDLEHEMGEIESVLREHLCPELEDIAADSLLAPYEFSLGRPLSHEPLVQCALDLLHWVQGSLKIDLVGRLLLSPYFAGTAQEVASRAEFEYSSLKSELRFRPEVTIKSLLRELRRSSVAPGLPMFLQVVGAIESAQSNADLRRRGFGKWSEWIREWLILARWGPLDATTTSREYQVQERWESTLDDLARLDFLGEMVSLDDALAILDRLVKERIFAPRSKESPVQVLGPLEAAGQHFDAVWVLRAGELSWPPSSAPLPFLPMSLQRDLGMPGTDGEQDRGAAQRLTRRIAGSAPQIIFSYSHTPQEGGHQRAAAVLRELHLPEVSLSTLITPIAKHLPVALEHVPDGSPLDALPARASRGGVRILELQAACGFRAFAELRLGCSKPNERNSGLNALERGNLVHMALEAFWSRVGSQRELINMSLSQRDESLREAVSRSLAGLDRSLLNQWDAAYLDTQKSRLLSLLSEWLALEERRPEFTVIAHEKRRTVSVGPLQLSLRVDRVDSVDGHQVIIDYKTGLANPSEWLSDRPDKPQVPLYAILSQEQATDSTDKPSPLGAVAFAQVRAGNELRLRGLEAAPGMLSTSGSRATMDAETFEAQVLRWRLVLDQLAAEFARGDARVRPKRYPSTCERCGQRLLCRIDASLFVSELDDAAPDGDETIHG